MYVIYMAFDKGLILVYSIYFQTTNLNESTTVTLSNENDVRESLLSNLSRILSKKVLWILQRQAVSATPVDFNKTKTEENVFIVSLLMQ